MSAALTIEPGELGVPSYQPLELLVTVQPTLAGGGCSPEEERDEGEGRWGRGGEGRRRREMRRGGGGRGKRRIKEERRREKEEGDKKGREGRRRVLIHKHRRIPACYTNLA